MWEWDRAIVRPLAREALAGSVRDQAEAAGVPEDEADRIVADGERLLERYFEWAPAVDDFVPIRVETDFEVPIPDPVEPSRDLVTPSGEPVHYRGRVDLLVVDDDDNYWIVEHRSPWVETELLLLDQRGASFCWAWELFFLGMRIAGVIFNEVRHDRTDDVETATPPPSPAAGVRHRRMYVEPARAPQGVVTQSESRHFRRTRVPKRAAELEALRRQMAYEVLDMVSSDVRIYPNPSDANCSPCPYRAPCLTMNTGGAAAAEEILASPSYRDGGATT